MPLFSFFSWILPLRVADPDLEAVQDSKQPPNSAQNASSLTQAPVSYNHNSQIVDILHWVFAILLYAAFIMMASTISSNFKTILPGTILASHTQALQIVGYVCITWPSGMMLLGRRFKVLGLFQRLFHLNQTIWFLYMAVLLTIASS